MKPFHALVRLVAWPLRSYVRYFPLQRGKGFVLRRCLRPLLGLLGEIELEVPPRGRVWLSARETLGLSWLVYGPFEAAEREHAMAVVNAGGWAIDVGANVGVFSASMGQALRSGSKLIAIEPLPDNAARIRRHMEACGVVDYVLEQCAVGEQPGQAVLLRAEDSAYSSLTQGVGAGTEEVPVSVRTIDDIWIDLGRPPVCFAKLDIEGAELPALRGASDLLQACHPRLLVEVDDTARLSEIEAFLARFGYQRAPQPPHFESWNHVFEAGPNR